MRPFSFTFSFPQAALHFDSSAWFFGNRKNFTWFPFFRASFLHFFIAHVLIVLICYFRASINKHKSRLSYVSACAIQTISRHKTRCQSRYAGKNMAVSGICAEPYEIRLEYEHTLDIYIMHRSSIFELVHQFIHISV